MKDNPKLLKIEQRLRTLSDWQKINLMWQLFG